MRISFVTSILLGVLFWAGCEEKPPEPKPAPKVTGARTNAVREDLRLDSGVPQPKLPTVKLWIGAETVTAEIAGSTAQIRKGMMFRTEMGENEGMLFVFGQPHRTSFYMKNTLIPLSGAYIDPEGRILEIHPMTPKEETPIEASSDNIQYVLEMPQGWFEKHGVTPGARVGTEHGSLRETFFREKEPLR